KLGVFLSRVFTVFAVISICYTLSAVSAFCGVYSDMEKKYENVAYTASMYVNESTKCLAVNGVMPENKNEGLISSKFPFMKGIRPVYAENYLSWMVFYMNNYGFDLRSCDNEKWNDSVKNLASYELKFQSPLFDVRSKDEVILIDFKN
ncbi:hypothetical protein VWS90_004308, partial [Cronobacter sakazakii]|nr:hypothetical protein [Cronobacter sakazakii]